MPLINVKLANAEYLVATEHITHVQKVTDDRTTIYLVSGEKLNVNISLAELAKRIRGTAF